MPRKKAYQNPDDYNKVFPVRLRRLMDEKSITQSQLAEKLGRTRQAVSNYCDGSSSPTWESLALIAKEMNCSADYLLGLSNHRTKETEATTASEIGLSDDAILSISANRSRFGGKKYLYALNEFLSDDLDTYNLFCAMTEMRQTVRMVQNVLNQATDTEFMKVYSDRARWLAPMKTYTLNGLEECLYRRQLLAEHFAEMVDSIVEYSAFKKAVDERARSILAKQFAQPKQEEE